MDPIKNPFSPGAGSPPPELVGRDPVLEQARILLGRVKQKKPEKSMLLTGLRGVGKTVLLNEIKRMADGDGYRTISIEAQYYIAQQNPSAAQAVAQRVWEAQQDVDRQSPCRSSRARAWDPGMGGYANALAYCLSCSHRARYRGNPALVAHQARLAIGG